MAKDKRIDAYIENAQPFAQPILKKLRELVHKACPGVTETIKWGMPSFEYKGPYFGFASFKEHCVAGFWKYKLIKDPKGYLGENSAQGGEAMGNLGRMTSLKDLPPDKVMTDFFRQAKKLNDDGVKMPARKTIGEKEKSNLKVPKELTSSLDRNKKAKTVFDKASYSFRKEYAMWISEAKTEETKNKRLEMAIEWIADGKGRNWKYERKK